MNHSIGPGTIDVPLERILTHSRAKTFRACPRKHALAYTLGYRARGTSNALAFGNAVHKALERYWLLRLSAQIGDSSFTADPLEALDTLYDPFLRAKARVLCAAYFALWDVEAVTVLAVEAQFAFPLVNERGRPSSYWFLGGKIDLLVQLADGRIAIVEHKTSSEDTSAGGAYRDRLAMDSQVSIYFEGARSLGYEADVCIYDVLLKPTQSPLEATPIEQRKYTKATKTKPSQLYANQREFTETPDEYEARIAAVVQSDLTRFLPRWEVPRLESERTDAIRDLWATAQEILALENAVHPWPRRNPDACHTHGACEFLPVCRREASLDDGSIYVRVGPHPELQSEAEPPSPQESEA